MVSLTDPVPGVADFVEKKGKDIRETFPSPDNPGPLEQLFGGKGVQTTYQKENEAGTVTTSTGDTQVTFENEKTGETSTATSESAFDKWISMTEDTSPENWKKTRESIPNTDSDGNPDPIPVDEDTKQREYSPAKEDFKKSASDAAEKTVVKIQEAKDAAGDAADNATQGLQDLIVKMFLGIGGLLIVLVAVQAFFGRSGGPEG